MYQLKHSVIYKMVDAKTGQIYIGQTENFELRMHQHATQDVKQLSNKNKLANAIRKDGFDAFKIDILEEVDNTFYLDEAECKWIDYFDSYYHGLNSNNGNRYIKYSLGPIAEYTITGTFIARYKDIADACLKNNYKDGRIIMDWLNGKFDNDYYVKQYGRRWRIATCDMQD